MGVDEDSLVDQGIQVLREVLGDGWTVTELDGVDRKDAVFDARVELRPPDQSRLVEIVISAHRQVTPRLIEREIARTRNVLAHVHNPPVMLVVAPWISGRAQQDLRSRNIGYLDFTGNVGISIASPAIKIFLSGATRAPKASEASDRRSVTLAGPRAGRIVRFLADFEVPYQATEISEATGVSLAWVSRLLKQLTDQLLIRREGRSIVDVDWRGLLRARAETYDLLRHNHSVGAVPFRGMESVLDALTAATAASVEDPDIAVTGPYASRVVAPLAAGGQLMLYVRPELDATDEWLEKLGLLRVEEGAEVLLLRAHDRVVFERTRRVQSIPHVALSQLALDDLAGPGRMPAEGEAVIQVMERTLADWRVALREPV